MKAKNFKELEEKIRSKYQFRVVIDWKKFLPEIIREAERMVRDVIKKVRGYRTLWGTKDADLALDTIEKKLFGKKNDTSK